MKIHKRSLIATEIQYLWPRHWVDDPLRQADSVPLENTLLRAENMKNQTHLCYFRRKTMVAKVGIVKLVLFIIFIQ